MKKCTYFLAGHGGTHVITALKRLRQEDISLEATETLSQNKEMVIETAQQVEQFAAKPDDLSLVPRAHMVEERMDSYRLSSDYHVLWPKC